MLNQKFNLISFNLGININLKLGKLIPEFKMLLLGIDIGTSSIKASVVDSVSQKLISSSQFPENESPIESLYPGWAEQSPELWWDHVQKAILLCHQSKKYDPHDIGAIGIGYQMHGLVIVDKNHSVLRNSIIWCDSRSVEIGEKAFHSIGEGVCLSRLLNSPGNFTASKLAWVKENEPEIYGRIDKIMLPGDFIGLKLTGEITTSISSLSEGIFFDFLNNELSQDILNYFGFSRSFFPEIKPVFSHHGNLLKHIAFQLGLKEGIPLGYKAGDQPNNALSLNVFNPGEVAATGGTSGVIYAVTDKLITDPQSRINTFAHVNHTAKDPRFGVLLCINGTGSMNRWAKNNFHSHFTYSEMNAAAGKIKPGSEGLRILPFGNGAERMLGNRLLGARIEHIDVNLHNQDHLFRGVQEGIAFSFRYGLDIMRENGLSPKVIRAGKANLFLSGVFTKTFVEITGIPIELFNHDGSKGAALGAGIGIGLYANPQEAFQNMEILEWVEPTGSGELESIYQDWKRILGSLL